MQRGDTALEVSDLRVDLGGKTVLDGAGLTLRAGELVAVVGPNGAGKSTMVRAAAGLQRFERGAVRWMGEPLGALRARRLALIRAFVPQRGRVPEGVTVHDAVTIGRSAHLRVLQRATRADHVAVDQALARAGVEGFRDRQLSTLSGGELQRVQIAVALAQEAPVLIADEPTSQLDLGATVEVAKLLRGLADDGLAVLLVAHDLGLAAAVADSVVVIHQGRSVATGPPTQALSTERLREVWGVDASLEARAERTALHVDWLGTAHDR